MIILTVAGRELSRLDIVEYAPKYELLDGEGTGRTRAPGWDMIRDPQGVLCNFNVTIYETRADNPDFQHLMNAFISLGTQQFVSVTHRDPRGLTWTQDMYFIVGEMQYKTVSGGIVWVDDFEVQFIAQRGTVR